MDNPQEQQLEQFIHQQLQKLPEKPAPENLVANVMARIAERKERPWYQQPFSSWPKLSQVILYLLSLSLLSALAWAFSGPAEQVSLTALYQRALSFAWVPEFLGVLLNAFLVVLRSVHSTWFLAAAAILALMHLLCIAGGIALYRLTFTRTKN